MLVFVSDDRRDSTSSRRTSNPEERTDARRDRGRRQRRALHRQRPRERRPRGAAHRAEPGRRRARRTLADGVEWLVADACEVASLRTAGLERCDVVVAATGDDEDNLVISLLAKQEFGVPRVVARVNHPKNEWLFNENWGVDLSVSTPHLITALVEEAVSVGRLVRILQFEGGNVRLVEVTLADDAPVVDQAIKDLDIPRDATIVAVVRGEHVVMPRGDTIFEAGDEVLAMVTARLRRRRPPDPDRRLRTSLRRGAARRASSTQRAACTPGCTSALLARRRRDDDAFEHDACGPATARRSCAGRGRPRSPTPRPSLHRRLERVGARAGHDADRAHLAGDPDGLARLRPVDRRGAQPLRTHHVTSSCGRAPRPASSASRRISAAPRDSPRVSRVRG